MTISCLGCEPEHDIEVCRQLADPRAGDRSEIDRDRRACLRIANAPINAVALIRRLALDVTLCRQELLGSALDLEVDVPASGRCTGPA